MIRAIVAAGFAVSLLGASAGGALAWGCTAQPSDGAYGYSKDWPDEQDAELTALKECERYATTNDCETVDCDPNL